MNPLDAVLRPLAEGAEYVTLGPNPLPDVFARDREDED